MLPATMQDLKSAMRRTQEFAATASSGGTYIKMDKGGQWSVGADNDEVEATSEWAINPAAFFTGYAAFDAQGQKHGEQTSTLTQPPVSAASLPNVPAPWKPLIGTTVKCLKGEDKGLAAIVSQSSMNGMKSLGNVLNEVMKKIDANDENCVPVVTLGHSKYRHTKYGMIYSADFTIVRWISATEAPAEEVKALEEVEEVEVIEAEPVEEPAPTTRRRRRVTA